ncbi:MAG: helix-hairpin-helix domain-containing protein [Bacillota bacterium]|nr:helix-hairpin-helix domain-containing protein [Bacillota bacterium]
MDGLVVVLRDTGHRQAGLPVLLPHERPEPVLEVLRRGFSGRLLRLYRMLQERLCREGGREPEPAYILLSGNDGGFARTGFHLGAQDKSHAAYVDLKQDWPLTGGWGAVDQIFPHELGHVIMRLLVGSLPPGGSNQVHAISVRTDPVLAFEEGFAEHLQVMAMDDPDAAPDTRALALDPAHLKHMDEQLRGYLHEMAGMARIEDGLVWVRRFPMWFSRVERVERYHAVKANRFARDPAVPDHLLDTPDPYAAYLIENIVPGGPDDRPRAPGRACSTEGFASTFFVRLVSMDATRRGDPEEGFCGQFGVGSADVSPVEKAYLKIFHVLGSAKPCTLRSFAAAYCAAFAKEAPALEAMLRKLLVGQEYQSAPQLWLANPWFLTGTSVWDQYRCAPRRHTFDLNAASATDLAGVPGVDRDLARRILERTPFADLAELGSVRGITAGALGRFREMSSLMPEVLAAAEEIEAGLLSSLPLILRSFGMV